MRVLYKPREGAICFYGVPYMHDIPNSSHRKGRPTLPLEPRFWRYVNRGSDSVCWQWTGGHNADGYGRFIIDGKVLNAHRVSWMITHGDIPPGYEVCHSCDNPPCVNPAHLYLGTHQQNMLDMSNKGRSRQTKLTPEQIRIIRTLRASGYSLKSISSRFSISDGLVSMIAHRVIWRGIKD